jgi:adenylate cyclase
MASIISGYEYDIFISYRQKDNKHDGWVTEFVNNLKGELEATFKEDISLYFDINPHDGLLETHDVADSLKDKLKCLVFIPIISRTYCDPKSFAWEHEFKAFIEQATHDQFGMKVKLPNGNVASRVLPVRIHDLDSKDLLLCESALGGYLRGVEFIYSKPGINRPLKPDDDEKTNIYATKYRDQINKVANAINEIISGLKGETVEIASGTEPVASPAERPLIKEKSIIVLPFENISNDPEQEYFSDGLTEEIITDLSHIQELLVISRNSAMAYKGARKKTGEIAAEVNVRYVLEGSVRKAGDKLRITAQLINASDGYLLWSERFDRGMGDIFDIQDELTSSIVNHLKVKLKTGEKAMLEKHYTNNTEAYALYLKGLYFYARTSPESYEKALNCFQAAINKDPDFAQAYTGMGQVFAGMGVYSFAPPAQMLPKAKAALYKALSLDENLAEAHAVTAMLAYWFEWDWEAAGRSFDRALALNPGDAMAHAMHSMFLVTMNRPDDAIREIKKAIELDPLMPLYYAWSVMVHNCAWRFDEALLEFARAMEIDPNNGLAFFHAGATWFGKGLLDKAIETWEKGEKFVVFPGYSEGSLAIAYMFKGDLQRSQRILGDMIEQKKTINQTSSVFIAWVAGNLGKLDLAFEFLDRGYEERDIMMTLVNVVTEFYCPPMLTDPRFKALLARMKLDFIPSSKGNRSG